MVSRVKNEDAYQLFKKLSSVELKHQDRIFEEHLKASGTPLTRDEFAQRIVGLSGGSQLYYSCETWSAGPGNVTFCAVVGKRMGC